MYWAEASGQKVRRADLDGSRAEDLVSSVGAAEIALDVAAGKDYWADNFVTGWIQRANLNGTGVENLNTVASYRTGIALDVAHGKIYWSNRFWGDIERSNLDGTGWEFLVTNLDSPVGIALDVAAGKMYWGNGETRRFAAPTSTVQR